MPPDARRIATTPAPLAQLIAAAGDPAGLVPAREQMALSLGWHIILACFGVAFPVVIFLVHRRGLRGDAAALTLARRWSKVAAVLFAIGAVSGTILSFEMGLLWPRLMGRFGDVLGLPFALEGISFFVEAIFLGAYLYGWDRLPPRVHLATLLPSGLAGITGTYCVVSVNAWMNFPGGFRLTPDGRVTDVRPLAVLFGTGAPLTFLHLWVGAFMVVGFSVAGAYAAGMLRGRTDQLHRVGVTIPLAVASVAALVQPGIGHLTGTLLTTRQPAKLASMELAPAGERRAPLRIGGVLIDGQARYAIEIPRLGSILATSSVDGRVPGLADVPPDERPRANVVHLSFQAMVGIGTGLWAFVALFWLARWRGRDLLRRRWFLWAVVAAGPLSALAVELGWIVTEVGRQPWVVWQVLRTRDAASANGLLWVSFATLVVLYTALTVGAVVVLRSMSRRWRHGEAADLPTPYGPDGPARDDRGDTEPDPAGGAQPEPHAPAERAGR